MDPFKRTDIRKHGFRVYVVSIKFSILHLSTLYRTIYRGLSFKGALHVTEIRSPSKRLSRRLPSSVMPVNDCKFQI